MEKSLNLSAMDRSEKKTLSVAMSGLGLQSMSTMLLSFVLTSMIAEFNVSASAAGFISTITNMGMLIGGVIFGVLADSKGRAKMFALTVFIFALATGLLAFADNIIWVYVLRFFVGVGGGGEYGIIMSMVADTFSTEKRGRINSFVTIAGQLGSIVAAVAAALLIPSMGWRSLFLFGALPILLAIYAYFKVEDPKEWKEEGKKQENTFSILELFKAGRASVTIRLTIMAIAQVAGYFGLMNWLPSILQKKAGLTVSGSSYWMIATIVGMSLGMLVFGQIMDKIGAKTAYALFLIASAAGVFIYSFADSSLLILLGGAVVGFFANGMNAGYGAIVGNYYPSSIRATANNIIFNIGRAVGGFSSVVIGFLLENYSLTIAMLFLSIMYLISLACALTLKNNKKEAVTQ